MPRPNSFKPFDLNDSFSKTGGQTTFKSGPNGPRPLVLATVSAKQGVRPLSKVVFVPKSFILQRIPCPADRGPTGRKSGKKDAGSQ